MSRVTISLPPAQQQVDGKLTGATGGATYPILDPATGEEIGVAPDSTGADVEAAIAAARRAFDESDWSTDRDLRVRCLRQLHAALLEEAEEFKALTTAEVGMPGFMMTAAGFDVPVEGLRWVIDLLESYEFETDLGEAQPLGIPTRRTVRREPVGVVAAISPWNVPTQINLAKIGPALAAGCTVVINPSDFTPFSALALGVLAERAGIPAGVINIVTGLPVDIGAELTSNPTVRKLSFTGSTRIGSLLMEQCAPTVKRLSLELGGNAPFIVFDDADADAAVEGAIASKFRNGGQTCVCSNRILVQSGIYDTFAEKLSSRVNAMKVGSGVEDGMDIGPMINRPALEKIDRHVKDAVAKGAKVIAQAPTPDSGQYAAPMVLSGCDTSMELASEETFGPVAPLFRFETEEEAVEIANATPFGLAAYFYTENNRRAWRVGEALEFGMVGLNTGVVSTTVSPFGGVKQSGLGREGARAGIEEYLETKAFHMGGL